MSYEVAVLWSILRSVVAGAACLGLGRVLVSVRSATEGLPEKPLSPRNIIRHSGLLLVPFFVPGLVVGYAYRNALLSFVQSPLLNELLYLLIVIAQLTPMVVLTLEWLPAAPLGATAQFLRHLAERTGRTRSLSERLRALLVGELPKQWTAGSLAALLCFQEVEVATLMQAQGWPEWIFAKQAGGIELIEVWRYLVLPVGYGLLLTVPTLTYWVWASRSGHCSPVSPSEAEIKRRPPTVMAAGIGLASWGLVVVWPFTSLLIGAFRGRGVIRLRGAIWQEIGDALVLGLTVTLLLGLVLSVLSYRGRSVRDRLSSGWSTSGWALLGVGALLPGMLGALSLGLVIFEIGQRIGWSSSYSPGPLMGALCLFLLPRALAMHAILRRNEDRTGLYLAQQMAQPGGPEKRVSWGQAIVWRMQTAGRFWMAAILFWWGYLELTLPELLRPAGMAPAPMRLYNLLHYDHRPGLAAMLALVLAVPIFLVIFGWSVGWLLRRNRVQA